MTRRTIFTIAIMAALGCDTDRPVTVQPQLQLAGPQDISLSPDADTYIKQGEPNQNQGAESILRVRNAGNNRVLLHWDVAAIRAAVGHGTLAGARLELSIVENGNNWGTRGRGVALHWLTRPWTEGGATWNCAVDANPANHKADCSGAAAWDMTSVSAMPWVPIPGATQIIRNGQTGKVVFDVTAELSDAIAGTVAFNGWILKKMDEDQNGMVAFASRETSQAPRLVLSVTNARADQPLIVIRGDGVIGSPDAPGGTYPGGSRATYSFTPASGYTNLTVYVDGAPVSAAGSVLMDTAHVLTASAERVYSLIPGTEGLVASARGLLTATDPVGAFQDHINAVASYIQQTDPATAENALAAVYHAAIDPQRDSAALDRLDRALGGNVFDVPLPHPPVQPAPWRTDEVATADSAEPTVYLYINGIWTDLDRVKSTWNALINVIKEAGELNTPRARVTWFYNPTRSDQALDGDAKRVDCAFRVMSGPRDYVDFSRHYDACMSGRVLATENDLVEAIGQWFSLRYNHPIPDNYVDSLKDRIRSYREVDGSHVLILPHSQGNLLTAITLNALSAEGALFRAQDTTFLGVVALASPTDRGWPLDGDHLRHVTLRGDVVPNAGLNAWPREESGVADQRDDVMRMLAWLPDPVGVLSRSIASLYYGIRLHEVDGVYFGDTHARQSVIANLVELYRNATVGSVDCGLMGDTYSRGQEKNVARFVTVRSRSGKPLEGREIDWSSSDTTVARINGLGTIFTKALGKFTITARSWQASCHADFTVVEDSAL